ncbi:hypothetical protein Y032_1278g3802 [Ancylostoma ceylanicum]|uniref:Saposin B-type domain-containing protein n=1 Tax=Ancylostoma ceylanicum TaxID=53326 RepID=A0A016W7C7_9BILA|nr:hypothetical protein Y032_1278g3802 [Ancylostoma ceylanicum]
MEAFLLLVLVIGCTVQAQASTDCNTCAYTLTALGRISDFDIPDGCRNYFTEDRKYEIICNVMKDDEDVRPGAYQLCHSLIREINDKGLMDEVLKLNHNKYDWRTYKFCMKRFSKRYCINEVEAKF